MHTPSRVARLALALSPLGLLLASGAHAQTPDAAKPAPLLPPPPTGTYTAGAGLALSNTNVFSIKASGVVASMIAAHAVTAGKIAVPLALSGSSSSSVVSSTNTGSGSGLYGSGSIGVNGSGTSIGVNGSGNGASSTGVFGSGGGIGVYGSSAATGVYGVGYNAVSGSAVNNGGNAVVGDAEDSTGGTPYGVYGINTDGHGYAGYFNGSVHVSGTFSNAVSALKIDHPQDPSGKYLVHASVESDQMMNVYRGHVTLDAQGKASVTMPSWFEALNEDFDYQLTCVGGYAPVYISQEVTGGRFAIAGGKPGLKVCWMVTGVRHDAFARVHPLVVEQEKPDNAKGTSLAPEAFGQPQSKSESYSHIPH